MPAAAAMSLSTSSATVRSPLPCRGALRLRTYARASWSKSGPAFSSPSARSLANGKPERRTATKAAEEESPVTEIIAKVTDQWEKTEDKSTVLILGFSGFLAFYVGLGVVGYIDKIPLVSTAFELIGLVFTAWFVYRYLVFKPDREKFFEDFGDWKSKVFGQK